MTRALCLLCLAACATGCQKSVPPVPPAPTPVAPGAALVSTADESRRYFDRANGFTYVPPEGWEIREVPGLKSPIIFGPPADGFAPNVNFVEETFGGSLARYVELNRATLKRAWPTAKHLQQSAFQSNSGLQGQVEVIERREQGRMLRQTFYFLENGNRKFVVTCTCLAPDGQALAPVFEQCLKSFRFEN